MLQFPILVTDATDGICDRCMKYPAVNFCRGPSVRRMDRKSVANLGIGTGSTYTFSELSQMFEDARAAGKKVRHLRL